MAVIESTSCSFDVFGVEESSNFMAFDGIGLVIMCPVVYIEVPDVNVESLFATEDDMYVRVVLADLVYYPQSGIFGDGETSYTDTIQLSVMIVGSPEEVEVNVHHVLSSYWVCSVGLVFLSHPFWHQVVEDRHVEVKGSIFDGELPQ